MLPRPLVAAFLVSLGIHGSLGMWVKVRPGENASPSPPAPDVWSGRGIEVEPAPLEAPASESATETAAASHAEAAPGHPSEHTVALEPACTSDCATPAATARETKPIAATKTTGAVPTRPAARVPPPAASTASPSPSAASRGDATTSGAVSSPGGAFGMVGLPPGVRYLPKAYTRALSQGSWGVAGFRDARPGKLCDAHIALTVEANRSIGPVEYRDERERDALPAPCRTLFENARRLVANGEFSLDPKELAGGVMRLHIEVEVTDGEPRAEAEAAPNGLWSESHEPPGPGRRGRSSFVLNSGRRVDAFVELE